MLRHAISNTIAQKATSMSNTIQKRRGNHQTSRSRIPSCNYILIRRVVTYRILGLLYPYKSHPYNSMIKQNTIQPPSQKFVGKRNSKTGENHY